MDSSVLHRSLDLWSQPPPEPRSRMANNPTLLYSWWATCFSAAIIITRLCGRKIRSNMLFREDWIMFAALVPLFGRMAFVHVVLLHGTNNVRSDSLTELQVQHRELGSRMVLGARIFYALFIWVSKLTVSEFLKRITIRIWRRSYELTLQGIRIFLFVTFAAVVISTLAECQPFDHYWQVRPDPGPHCRLGFAQLITMGTCDIVTDILLVAFPIPIVLRSGQTWKRKFQLVSLFSLSIIMIGVTATRMPKVISHQGRQQYRTVWASCEILASAAVSNAVILGSFLRDKGTKKNKYRSHSVSDSIDRASVRRTNTNGHHSNDSDEDLFRVLGMRVPEHLREKADTAPRPAQAMPPASRHPSSHNHRHHHHHHRSRSRQPDLTSPREDTSSSSSDSLRKPVITANTDLNADHDPDRILPNPKRNVSFLDVGGLLENGSAHLTQHQSRNSPRPTMTSSRSASPSHMSHATTLVSHADPTTIAHDFAQTPSPSRRGSRALVLSDVGDLLARSTSRTSSGFERYIGRRQSDSHIHPPSRHTRAAPTGVLGPMIERAEWGTGGRGGSLRDVGGLLGHGGGRGSTDVELRDLGGLMDTDRSAVDEDASAAALRRAQARDEPVNLMSGSAAECRRQDYSNEGPDLSDPGGLLR